MNERSPAESFYDKLAARYDRETFAPEAWTPPEHVAHATAKVANVDSVLIIGVGTGQDIDALGTHAPAHIEGIDVSGEMLALCRAKHPRVLLHHADFMTFNGLLRQKYNLIVCSGTLEFIEDFEGFFVRCSQLLAPQGMMIITYEPLIPDHALQSKHESETVSERSSKFGIKDFKTYRRSFDQFSNAIARATLQLHEHYDFVAYRKLETDIIYHFVVLKGV